MLACVRYQLSLLLKSSCQSDWIIHFGLLVEVRFDFPGVFVPGLLGHDHVFLYFAVVLIVFSVAITI